MPTLTEGELVFQFPDGVSAIKFDGQGHGLSHCMSAVDFIVELSDRLLFVEVKDPNHSGARPKDKKKFATSLYSGTLSATLGRKIRDSLAYRWAEGPIGKDVYYVVLVELSSLNAPDYITVTDSLRRQIPTVGLPPTWARPLVKQAVVLNMTTWNRIGAYGTVHRVVV